MHFNARVIERNPEITVGVLLGLASIDTSVRAHRPVMKPVQIDAFAVYFFELVVFVSAVIDVAGRIDSHRRSEVFEVHFVQAKTDAPPGISHYFHLAGMAYLDGIAPDIG